MENKSGIKMAKPKVVIPEIQDLYDDENLDLSIRADQLQVFLNQNPPEKWIKKNPYAGNSNYIPIDKIEWMLRKFFKGWKPEVLEVGVLFNSVYANVRLHYIDPVTSQWVWVDGVGASQIQTKKGSSPADLQNINNNAVMMALPNAKTMAIKDAAECIGRIFGSDINRKDILPNTMDTKLQDVREYRERERLTILITEAGSLEKLESYKNFIVDDAELLKIYENEKAKF